MYFLAHTYNSTVSLSRSVAVGFLWFIGKVTSSRKIELCKEPQFLGKNKTHTPENSIEGAKMFAKQSVNYENYELLWLSYVRSIKHFYRVAREISLRGFTGSSHVDCLPMTSLLVSTTLGPTMENVKNV